MTAGLVTWWRKERGKKQSPAGQCLLYQELGKKLIVDE
jgi:hypothetical protein